DRPSIVRGSGQRPSAPATEPPATSVAKSDGGEPRTSTPKAETSASVSKPVANPNAAANRPRPSRSSGVTPPLILGADPARSANSTPTPSQRSASSAGVRNFAVNTAPSEASGSSA